MSQRPSGYARQERDAYYTPEWVTEALLPHIPYRIKSVWEPACGSGKMVKVFQESERFQSIHSSDIDTGRDFLKESVCFADAIITNPPFGGNLAQEFIEHALELTRKEQGFVAMLLRTDFDHAKTRQHLFRHHLAFSKKLVLLKRIKWFENSTGSPSYNHCWMIWDWTKQGWPVIDYGP